jgi:hypothetical protein
MAKIQNNILFLASPARGGRPAGVTIIYPGKTRVKRWISNDWFEDVEIDTLGMKQEDPDYNIDGFNYHTPSWAKFSWKDSIRFTAFDIDEIINRRWNDVEYKYLAIQ